MITIQIDKKKYLLPASYEELNSEQLMKVGKIVNAEIRENKKEISVIDYNSLRMVLFHELLEIKSKTTLSITAEQWHDILPLLNFCFEAPKLTTNKILKISNSFTNFFGPQGLLDKSSFAEMIAADHAYQNALLTGDNDSFMLLASILYRPKRSDLKAFINSPNWNGDIREPFNLQRAQDRISIFKKIDKQQPGFITAVFLLYQSFRSEKLEKFEDLFKPTKGRKPKRDIGWFAVALELSASKFGNFEQTLQTNWFNVLVQLEREQEKSENIKKIQ